MRGSPRWKPSANGFWPASPSWKKNWRRFPASPRKSKAGWTAPSAKSAPAARLGLMDGSTSMPLVNVMVNGRAYTIACDEGEEDHLRELAGTCGRQGARSAEFRGPGRRHAASADGGASDRRRASWRQGSTADCARQEVAICARNCEARRAKRRAIRGRLPRQPWSRRHSRLEAHCRQASRSLEWASDGYCPARQVSDAQGP